MNNDNQVEINKEVLLDLLGLDKHSSRDLQRLIELKELDRNEAEQRNYEKKNPSFVQLYKGKGLKALGLLIQKNPFAGQLLIFFLENMNNKNLVVASQQLLMEETQKGRTTIYKAIKYLEENKYINVAKIGSANAYIVNPEIAFQDAHDKKRYVSFEGTILLSKEENKALFYDKYNYENMKVLQPREEK